jgi:hypothetical protein
VLLAAEIIPNENLFFNGKDICFNFQPDEIGPFSMGEKKYICLLVRSKTL